MSGGVQTLLAKLFVTGLIANDFSGTAMSTEGNFIGYLSDFKVTNLTGRFIETDPILLNPEMMLQLDLRESAISHSRGEGYSLTKIAKNTKLKLWNTTFKSCISVGRGGGVFYVSGENASVDGRLSSFDYNQGITGGIAYAELGGRFNCHSCLFSENAAL